MTLPLLGTLSVSGFQDPWFFLYAGVIALLAVAYVASTSRRRRRALRFANFELLQRVAPLRPRRWRHLPVILLALALVPLTIAMANPTADQRIPRDRAVVMLVIDVSESMAATDVAPSRIEAAKEAGKRFAHGLRSSINLGLVEFSSSATMLVPPTTDRAAMDRAIDRLEPKPRTATGEGLFTALQAIATVESVLGGDDGQPAAARIVLESDGKETVPMNPDDPRGAYTAARAARDQGVEISTISFGTPYGTVDVDGKEIPVPVDDATLRTITQITTGTSFSADSLTQLDDAYAALQRDIGYRTVPGNASSAWILLGLVALGASVVAGLLLGRHIPD